MFIVILLHNHQQIVKKYNFQCVKISTKSHFNVNLQIIN
jgi:hypothetical protein